MAPRAGKRFGVGQSGSRTRTPPLGATSFAIPRTTNRRGLMWWGIGGAAALLWIILFVWLGLSTLRNGHGWMFFFGIFFPLLWIFGAFMRPPSSQAY
jgi:hypothetical protein